MSADRELLELAAKAAGMYVLTDGADWPIENVGWFFNQVGDHPPALYDRATRGRDMWSPLTDDGDALRLAVAAKVDMQQGHWVTATVWLERSDTHFFSPKEKREEFGADPYAATRRAIVRAAAEIGKAKP